MKDIDTECLFSAVELNTKFKDSLSESMAALSDAESALAVAMIEMAEARCKGFTRSNERVQASLLAREIAIDNLTNLRNRTSFKLVKFSN